MSDWQGGTNWNFISNLVRCQISYFLIKILSQRCAKGKGLLLTCFAVSGGEQEVVLSSALGWDVWSTPRPGRFTSGEDPRCTSYTRLGGPGKDMEGYGEEKIFLFHRSSKPLSVQLSTCSYTMLFRPFKQACVSWSIYFTILWASNFTYDFLSI